MWICLQNKHLNTNAHINIETTMWIIRLLMLHQPNFTTLYSRRHVLPKLKGQQNLAIQTYMHILDVHMCILYIYIKSLSIFDTINVSIQRVGFYRWIHLTQGAAAGYSSFTVSWSIQLQLGGSFSSFLLPKEIIRKSTWLEKPTHQNVHLLKKRSICVKQNDNQQKTWCFLTTT